MLGRSELVPIVTGGMGVHFSTPELALEACRLGGVGHISDAMVPFVSDRRYGTKFTQEKLTQFKHLTDGTDKSAVRFMPEVVRQAEFNHVRSTMDRKKGSGMVFINVMEKLTMGDPIASLQARLAGALDGGVDGVTLSAGLHQHSLRLIEDHPRFFDVKLGIIVSSVRALKIFLRSAERSRRRPDFIVVEGPLAGGHLGFGEDWQQYNLAAIVAEIIQFVKDEELNIPVIAAGGIFTGSEAVEFLRAGAAAVQVATRFTVTRECGIPEETKQKYFSAEEQDVVVNCVSPTGYLMRMLKFSPCLKPSAIKPNCEAFGYILGKDSRCQYLDAYQNTPVGPDGKKLPVEGKVCLCYHFSNSTCYTCGHNVFRLKDTSIRKPNGQYQLLTVEHVFNDYLFGKNGEIRLPEPEADAARPLNSAQQLAL